MRIGVSYYYCPSCKTTKDLSAFNIKKSGESKGDPQGYCKSCATKKRAEWEAANREHAKKENMKRYQRLRAKQVAAGIDKLHTNKKCTMYLNRVVAEEALSKYFQHVDRKRGHGFSFICDKKYKIAVRSSCMRITGSKPFWSFGIYQNNIADYFLFLTFDDRDHLNPQKIWLVPSNKISDHKAMWVTCNSDRAEKRLSEYEKPIDKMTMICNEMKGVN